MNNHGCMNFVGVHVMKNLPYTGANLKLCHAEVLASASRCVLENDVNFDHADNHIGRHVGGKALNQGSAGIDNGRFRARKQGREVVEAVVSWATIRDFLPGVCTATPLIRAGRPVCLSMYDGCRTARAKESPLKP
jgi:hypothetical protein